VYAIQRERIPFINGDPLERFVAKALKVKVGRAGPTLCILLVFFGVVSLLRILTLVTLRLQGEAQHCVA
jgi:hypothetical protein